MRLLIVFALVAFPNLLLAQTAKLRTPIDKLGICTYSKFFGGIMEFCTTETNCYAEYNTKTGYLNYGWRPPCENRHPKNSKEK